MRFGKFALPSFLGLMIAGFAVAPAARAGAPEGKQIFASHHCIKCHSLGKEKGKLHKVGKALDGVGTKRDAAWLKKYLTDPKSVMPDASMPKIDPPLSAADLDSLVAYMASLK